jgi:hypothetical protein
LVSPSEARKPTAEYTLRIDRYAQLHDADAVLAGWISHARLALFGLLLVAGVMAERSDGATAWLVVAVLAAAGFLGLLVFHQRVRRRMAWHAALVRVNRAGLARLNRDWAALPERRSLSDVADHPYAQDLDVFGRGALVQVLGPTSTPHARRALEAWLLGASDPDAVRERQAGARELAGLVDYRDAVAVRSARAGALTAEGLQQFIEWCTTEPWLLRRRALVLAARVIPVVTVSLMIADAAGWTERPLWLFSLGISLLMMLRWQSAVRRTFRTAFQSERIFDDVPELFGALASVELRAPLSVRLRGALLGDVGAERELQRLFHLSHLADLPLSSVGAIVNIILLWDFHVLHALERWQVRAASAARGWFEAAGSLEALCALGTLSYDHPDWCFPELLDAGAATFAGVALGHPLLRDDARVDNDLTLGPAGTFVLLTGSNMSGKSTLLRSIGVNVVLAQAGAPVCAQRLRMTPVSLQTSVRTQDSLVDGVSLFMAELRRTKGIIDAARTRPGGLTVMFLLDELLQGTNTAERRIASQRIIAHLLDAGAFGAVSTHDLTLLEGSALTERATLLHFTESFTDGQGLASMTFDYKLRPGLATSTNALKLMELLGLT